jgi:hypothetical protein
MKRRDELFIELQERFPACADYQPARFRRKPWPFPVDRLSELVSGLELSASRTVGADKIGITEVAHCLCAILLMP